MSNNHGLADLGQDLEHRPKLGEEPPLHLGSDRRFKLVFGTLVRATRDWESLDHHKLGLVGAGDRRDAAG